MIRRLLILGFLLLRVSEVGAAAPPVKVTDSPASVTMDNGIVSIRLDKKLCALNSFQCRVNGQMRQMASTRDMVFNVGTLIAYISSVMTLEPGDLIFTGTPAGVGELKHGDEVVVEIEGLGVLKNPVRAENK